MRADVPALAGMLAGAGDVRPGGPDDAVDGVPAAAVVRPDTVDAVSQVLREASRHGLVTVARGAGTAMDWAAPPERVDLVLDLTGLDRVVEHEAGDLVVVAQAGVPLKSLNERLGGAGQELAVDVPRERYDAGSTIGGILATAPSGPRRLQRLALRDLVLGVTLVLADGTVAASGGKVVKNVAGYDLAKLVTGSYGTLGVIVQAAFRLHPLRPARTFLLRSGPLEQVADVALRLLGSQLAPSAVELDRRPGSDEATVAVLLEGTEDAVAARAAEAEHLTGVRRGAEPDWWSRLPAGQVTAKVTSTLTGVRGVLEAARSAEHRHGAAIGVRGSAAGVLHAGVSTTSAATVLAVIADLRGAAPDPRDGTVVVLRAPAELRDGLDVWGPVGGLDLMREIKQRLDPGRTLSPGRFVGGI